MKEETRNEYNVYVCEHRENVLKSFALLVKYFSPKFCDYAGYGEFTMNSYQYSLSVTFSKARSNIYNHDESKFSEEEFEPYANHFYGDKKDDKEDEEFNTAWLHHIHNNPHHWEHWLLYENGRVRPLVMPDECVIEMVCDWGAFSYKKKDGNELLKWYESNKDRMLFHDKTRKTVEIFLPILAKEIDEYFEEKVE